MDDHGLQKHNTLLQKMTTARERKTSLQRERRRANKAKERKALWARGQKSKPESVHTLLQRQRRHATYQKERKTLWARQDRRNKKLLHNDPLKSPEEVAKQPALGKKVTATPTKEPLSKSPLPLEDQSTASFLSIDQPEHIVHESSLDDCSPSHDPSKSEKQPATPLKKVVSTSMKEPPEEQSSLSLSPSQQPPTVDDEKEPAAVPTEVLSTTILSPSHEEHPTSFFSNAEEQIIKEALYGSGNPSEVVTFCGRKTVQRCNLETLRPGVWLNDEVIHYYFKMLGDQAKHSSLHLPLSKRCHFFPSYFFTKLLNTGHADREVPGHPDVVVDGTYTYSNVQSWSKRVEGKDIFRLGKIIIPINIMYMHWCCAVVFMQEKVIKILDSLGPGTIQYAHAILQYLKDEHWAKKGTSLPDALDWRLVGTLPTNTPQQNNGK